MRVRVGIVGCGAIGSSLARAIIKDFSGQLELAALYDIDKGRMMALADSCGIRRKLKAGSLKELILRSDLVIEAACAKCAWEISRLALSGKRDIMIMSVGGIVNFLEKLRSLAKKKNCRVFIPSGAISGIDALKAARCAKIKEVTLTTTKNPASFKGVKYASDKGIILERIKKDTVLFSGSAQEAVKFFPQNINVAAVLSIAGVGKKNTRVSIVASPKARKNIHEISIDSQAAKIFTRTENVLHADNPKTSYLAVLSAIATLRQMLDPVKVGN